MFNFLRKRKTYFAHPTAVVDKGARIAQGCKIWHFSHIMAGAKLGEGCNIGQNVVISPQVSLGRNCKVQNNVSVYTGVTCGDDVFLGPSCVFTNVINPRSAVNRRNEYLQTHVGNGVSIGANATIVCGHNIGEYAFIGAGAVVVEDIPPYALVVGNPSRQIGWMSRAGARLEFVDAAADSVAEAVQESVSKSVPEAATGNHGSEMPAEAVPGEKPSGRKIAVCPLTGEKYSLEGNRVEFLK